MDYETNQHPENQIPSDLPLQNVSYEREIYEITEQKDLQDTEFFTTEIPQDDSEISSPTGQEQGILTGQERQPVCPENIPSREPIPERPQTAPMYPGMQYGNYGAPNPYYNNMNTMPRGSETPRNGSEIVYDRMGSANVNAGEANRAPNMPLTGAQPPSGNRRNPYERGYYDRPPYGSPYPPTPNGYYGGNFGYPSYGYPVKKQKKNKKPVVSLILGCIALCVLNYFPLVAFILGLLALCFGFKGLQEGNIGGGKKFCGIMGLILGIFTLFASSTMLIILISLGMRAMSQGVLW